MHSGDVGSSMGATNMNSKGPIDFRLQTYWTKSEEKLPSFTCNFRAAFWKINVVDTLPF